jgi:tetratricopeptide (TPR) repeat protein
MKEVDVRALVTMTMMVVLGPAGPTSNPARQAMTRIVAQIQKADYEGDRKALLTLAGEIGPYTKTGPLASRALYWRGFAMWRRALNGFNDSVDPKELGKDLTEAVRDFTDAAAKDPEFVDPKAAASACLFSLSYLNKDDAERRQGYIAQGVKLLDEAKKAAPENPRVLWVKGGGEWWVPAERGGGQAKAIETYERGLELARKQRGSMNDPLEPTSGEPELLMSLAWSYLNRAEPDAAAAESDARAALALVPNWHYVRDILLPQIRAKATEAAPTSPAGDPARKEASPADFDFLEGKWAIVYNNAQPGIPADLKGTWTAARQADGRVLYDEFRILGAKGETVALGASYRVFDHVRKRWDCRYVQLILPGAEGPQQLAQWAEFTAWREGSTLRVDQHGSRSSLRITYYDIAKDHLRWKADVSTDAGKTWKTDQIRIQATRASD